MSAVSKLYVFKSKLITHSRTPRHTCRQAITTDRVFFYVMSHPTMSVCRIPNAIHQCYFMSHVMVRLFLWFVKFIVHFCMRAFGSLTRSLSLSLLGLIEKHKVPHTLTQRIRWCHWYIANLICIKLIFALKIISGLKFTHTHLLIRLFWFCCCWWLHGYTINRIFSVI